MSQYAFLVLGSIVSEYDPQSAMATLMVGTGRPSDLAQSVMPVYSLKSTALLLLWKTASQAVPHIVCLPSSVAWSAALLSGKEGLIKAGGSSFCSTIWTAMSDLSALGMNAPFHLSLTFKLRDPSKSASMSNFANVIASPGSVLSPQPAEPSESKDSAAPKFASRLMGFVSCLGLSRTLPRRAWS